MKGRTYHTIGFLALLLLTTCTPKVVSWTNPDYEPTPIKKVVVMGIFNKLSDRMAFEDALVNALTEQGYVAVHGMAVIPPSFEITSQEDMERIFRADKFDAAIFSTVVDQSERLEYRSTGVYAGAYGPYAGPYYGPGYGMYNYYNYRYGYDVAYGNYGYGYGVGYESGYYTQVRELSVESLLFRIPDQDESQMVWVGHAEVTENGDVKRSAAYYSRSIVKSMSNGEIL